MNLIDFEPEHIRELRSYGSQAYLTDCIDKVIDERTLLNGPSFSGVIDGRIVGCAGLFEVTPYRAAVWAILDKTDRPGQFVQVHKAVVRFLNEQTYKRIDAQVAQNNPYGHRWVKALGFRVEVFARPWGGIMGETITEYVRWG